MVKIKNWIQENARPLEKALLDFHLNAGSKEEVIKALVHYQNKDGGFGQGLEPDFRNPESNPIACQFAMHIIHGLKLEKYHPMILGLINYLKKTPYKEDWLFYFRIPSNNEYPHAPWWHFEEKNKIEGYNPTASILGFMYRYMDEDDPFYDTIEHELDQAIRFFLNSDITEMHELRCFNELYEYVCEGIDCSNLRKKLLEQNIKAIETDSKLWTTSYVAKPSQVFVSMHSPGVHELMDLIEEEIQLMFKHRNKEGVFDVLWEWGQFPEAFKIAQKEWQGIIAYRTLMQMKEYKITLEE